ncbi:hypothetical protein YC2023_096592 [Brassica napus]
MDNDKNHKTEEPKPRLRWSYELHHRFIDAVNQLGGPNSSVSVPFVLLEPYQVWVVRSYFLVSFSFLFCYVVVLEATPKGLMRFLEIPELTLYHLKKISARDKREIHWQQAMQKLANQGSGRNTNGSPEEAPRTNRSNNIMLLNEPRCLQ